MEQRSTHFWKRNYTTSYLIFSCNGKKYEYAFVGDTSALRPADILIDNLIPESDFEKFSKLLAEKNFSVYFRDLYYPDYPTNTDRFQIVKIKKIIRTFHRYAPYELIFEKQDGSEHCTDVSLSGINIMHHAADVNGNMESFFRLFSFEDTRENFCTLLPAHLQLIKEHKIISGMTMEECILSLGIPRVTITGLGPDPIQEWQYGARYLFFSNHRLVGESPGSITASY